MDSSSLNFISMQNTKMDKNAEWNHKNIIRCKFHIFKNCNKMDNLSFA